MEGKNKKTDYRLLIRIFKLSFEFKKALWVSIILTLLASFLGPIRPILIQKTIDNYIAFGDKKGLIDMISLISSLLIFFFSLSLFVSFPLYSTLCLYLALSFILHPRKALMGHPVQKYLFSFYNSFFFFIICIKIILNDYLK